MNILNKSVTAGKYKMCLKSLPVVTYLQDGYYLLAHSYNEITHRYKNMHYKSCKVFRKKNDIHYKFSDYGLAAALVVIMSFLLPLESSAQTGTITGRVKDVLTGEPVTQVIVSIPETGHTTKTDPDGRFRLNSVPTGEQTIVLHTLGYNRKEVSVLIRSDETLGQNIELDGNFGDGDRVFFVKNRRNQAQALNHRQGSLNHKSSLNMEQMDRFADHTLEDAMGRFPGIQVDRRRMINIRGVGADRYQVMIDGQRLPTSGLGDRNSDLSDFSTDIARDLELIKVITPDMDADALAGAVNIKSSRVPGDFRHVNVNLGSGGNSRYLNQTGIGRRFSLQFAETFSDIFSMSANFSWQSDNRPWETLDIDYQVADFGNGPEDVIERVSPGIHTDDRTRIGGSTQMNFMPSESSRFYIRGLFNNHDRDLISHQNNFIAGGDWATPDSTGETGSLGSLVYGARFNDRSVQQYLVQAGGKHFFDRFDLQYSLGWAKANSYQQLSDYPFSVAGVNYNIDRDDRTRPHFTITNLPLQERGVLDQRRPQFQEFQEVYDNHVDNTYSSRIDVDVPVGPISFKLGSSARMTNKVGDHEAYDYRYVRLLRLQGFNKFRYDPFDVFDEYLFLHFVDTYSARTFFDGNTPNFLYNSDVFHANSAIWNYSATELIYAGYGMAEIQIGGLTILGGARIEQTDGKYEGTKAIFDDTGAFEEAIDTSRNVDYNHLFPHAQIGYAPGDRTNIRLAYSRTLARPEFNRLAPFERLNRQDSTLFRGNPLLDPMTSDNLDIWFDHYFSNIGVLSLGMFHKQLENFVFLRQQTLEGGSFAGWNERTYSNSDESATIYGVEVSWEQRFDFLPGFLGNLGTYTNYTWTDSKYEIDYRDDEIALPGQSPHVVNAALLYDQGRFSTQLSYHWTSESLSLIREEQTLVPSAGAGEQRYMDRYVDGWTDLSFSFRLRISEQFRFWADAYNLLGRERIEYEFERDLYPVSTHWVGGRSFRVGVRYDL